ncbi:uncharacterized protein LOC135681011 [Rhopilema esculentum]|uniref:uncharacterized protein LOC135681011 n=1 Tax=Rhopilema esculentum TaxID=499914 RepID=UPI0031D20F55|eukprot:gene12849-3595_t
MDDANKGSFALSGVDAKFRARNSAIFSGLSDLEEKHEQEVSKDDPFSENVPVKRQPRKPQRVPQHVLHPEKWTEYSLEEDGTQQLCKEGKIGDELNKNVALNFLEDLRKRKEDEDKNSSENTSKDFVNCSPSSSKGMKRKREQVELDDEAALNTEGVGNEAGINVEEPLVNSSGCAFRMRTYEFGQKQSRSANLHPQPKTNSKELCLSHLDDGEEKNVSIETNEEQINEEKEKPRTKFNMPKREKNIRKSKTISEDGDM